MTIATKSPQDFKFNEWELRGVPVRIEIGPRDIEKDSVAIARRDIPGKAGKIFIPNSNLDIQIGELLVKIQTAMLEKALAYRLANTHEPVDYQNLVEIVQNGWADSWWCEGAECEAKVKDDTKATTRCIPLDQPDDGGNCIVCGKPAKRKVIFARAY